MATPTLFLWGQVSRTLAKSLPVTHTEAKAVHHCSSPRLPSTRSFPEVTVQRYPDFFHTENVSPPSACPSMSALTLSVEYHSSTAASQGFVGCGGHHMAVFKRGRYHASRHQSTDVCHICHEICAIVISNLSQTCIIQVPRVAAGP